MIADLYRLNARLGNLSPATLGDRWHDIAMVVAAIIVLAMMIIGGTILITWQHSATLCQSSHQRHGKPCSGVLVYRRFAASRRAELRCSSGGIKDATLRPCALPSARRVGCDEGDISMSDYDRDQSDQKSTHKPADHVSADDPNKVQKLTKADDDFDPNEGQK